MPANPVRRFAAITLCAFLLTSRTVSGAGVTIITHGLNSNIDDWVIAMAQAIPEYYRFPGNNFSCYEIYFTNLNNVYVPTWRRLAGSVPQSTDSGEIIVKLDWRQLANNSYSTFQVAAAVAPVLTQTNFIAEWPNHALAELPIHMVGHSRGGSLICELSKYLGTNGIWIDHLTTLDPHPLNNDGFSDFPYTVVDAPARTYQNVLFHDNYFQNLNVVIYGESVPGAYVRQLTNLDGGYSGLTASHSDVHLWYHGTVDLQVPTDDGVATITASERQAWYTSYEQQGLVAGFRYSLIGGGDRTATNRPAGSGTPRIRDGFNQSWDLGAGLTGNRTTLPANNGQWANVMKFNILSTNVVAYGQTNTIDFFYQWARSTNAQTTVSIYTDDDFNPYTHNEHFVRDFVIGGTTADQIGQQTRRIFLNETNAPAGYHTLFAKVTTNGRDRYLYAPEILTVMSSFDAPRVQIARQSPSAVRVVVNGLTGQRIVLHASPDLKTWSPIATNWLTAPTWTFVDQTSRPRMLYRAAVQ